MERRWVIWTVAIFALALFALFPLRVALGLSELERMGFTARQVGGTIWYGRIGELHLRSQNLGTFEVAVNPAALLVGDVSMRFNRLESLEGPLAGRLVAGASRGMVDVSGRVAVGAAFAPLPIAAFELEQVTVLFRGGQCQQAKGRLRPVFAAAIPGVSFDSTTAGTIECDGQRARVRMRSAAGRETIEFYVNQSGRYRGWISTRADQPGIGAALMLFGFRPSAEGMTLTVNGEL